MHRIIIIEEDIKRNKTITEALEYNGYQIESVNSHQLITDFIKGKKKIDNADLYIIDVDTANLSGFEITQKLCSLYHNINALIICRKNCDNKKKEKVFYLNCYDYIEEPFEAHEILLKIDKVLNTKEDKKNYNLQVCKRVSYNTYSKELIVDNEGPIALTKQEQQLLDILSSKPNIYFPTEKIESIIWGDFVDQSYVRHLVNRLRKKIPCDVIKNKIGKGYKLDINIS